MGYTLYNRRRSGGFAVEAVLALAEAPFELIELDSEAGTPLPESFRATSPWGQVPVLVLPDGSAMTETAAILVHLALAFPEKRLAPPPGSSAHAAFLRWTVFANVNLYEAVLRRGYPFRFTDDAGGYDAVRSAAVRRMGEALAVIDAHVEEPFLLGAEMTAADIYLAMFLAWYRGGAEPPRLARIGDAVRRHPVIGPIWRRHYGSRQAKNQGAGRRETQASETPSGQAATEMAPASLSTTTGDSNISIDGSAP